MSKCEKQNRKQRIVTETDEMQDNLRQDSNHSTVDLCASSSAIWMQAMTIDTTCELMSLLAQNECE